MPTRYTPRVTPLVLALVGAALPAVIGLTGWAVRMLVVDRIRSLEDSRARMGERIGELESWRKAHEAVLRDRRRRDTRGVVSRDDESGS